MDEQYPPPYPFGPFPPGMPAWPQVWQPTFQSNFEPTPTHHQQPLPQQVLDPQIQQSTEIQHRQIAPRPATPPQAEDIQIDDSPPPAAAEDGGEESSNHSVFNDSQWLRRKITTAEGVAELRSEWDTEYANKLMPPPPPRAYKSKDEAVESARRFAKEHGYKIVIGHTYKGNSAEIYKLILYCSHSNRYSTIRQVAPEVRQRNRFSRKTNCPFRIRLAKRRFSDEWVMCVGDGKHNHAPDKNMALPLPAEYPDLDAALWEWHMGEIANGEVIHGNRLKSKAVALWCELPQFKGKTPPDLNREWLDGYRTRHKIPFKPLRPSGPPELVDWNDAEAVAAVISEVRTDRTREDITFNGVTQAFGDDDTLIRNVKDAVKDYMSNYDASHDWDHILRVLSLAKKMVRKENEPVGPLKLDPKTVYLAAICHDLGDHKYAKPGESVENQIAELLLQHGAPADLALKVQLIAKNVSFSNEMKNSRMVKAVLDQHPELGVVQDADRLDAIGAIGIGRTFVFTGAKKPDGSMMDTIEHFQEKLERLESLMKTGTGKALARERTERLRTFRQWWEEEYEVVD
ncbi:hypothetical protein K461DRAFT_291813 [Myriangium duriaei CBS 260.36]|uniref:HTH CENPB-type domain-containing protein n=1 Tax=Myriangium duriaei CBS 260.36 TaxID=1168546 RepID=A0A9P4J9S5_9PEZI|nr:hypothetical protein K461DRAFT_291813 [Myriangium duriaei CBS 260.36]